jgi:uncharacterized protein YndB with AHSA1/START domain
MTKNNFNMNEFSHSILLNAPLEEVFRYSATPNGLTKWFIGAAEYTHSGKPVPGEELISTGDTYNWKWLAKDFETTGKVVEVIKDERLKFTFGSMFEITISVAAENNRTRFTLTQNYTAGAVKNDFAHINCCVCWAFFITNLKSVIEHGIDLRETVSQDEYLVNR